MEADLLKYSDERQVTQSSYLAQYFSECTLSLPWIDYMTPKERASLFRERKGWIHACCGTSCHLHVTQARVRSLSRMHTCRRTAQQKRILCSTD